MRGFVARFSVRSTRKGLRWSPTVVELVLTDLGPRKLLLDADQAAELPAVLEAFVRIAAARTALEAELGTGGGTGPDRLLTPSQPKGLRTPGWWTISREQPFSRVRQGLARHQPPLHLDATAEGLGDIRGRPSQIAP